MTDKVEHTPEEEREHMDKVNVHANEATEDDEMDVLASLFHYDSKLGVFHAPLFEEE